MPKPTHLLHIGGYIKELRKMRSMSQDNLAEEAGVRLATISDIEAGKSDFKMNTLVRIASALKCTLDIVFTPA